MARRVASRGGGMNGTALCVRDKRKAQAAAAAAAAGTAATGTESGREYSQNGGAGVCCGFTNGHDEEAGVAGEASDHRPPYALSCAHSESSGRPPSPLTLHLAPVVIERSEVIRLASQYTSCAGCSAAVKGLLQRPIEELRLVNAVVEESDVIAGSLWETGGRGGGGRIRGGGDGRHKSNGSAVGGTNISRSGEGPCGQDGFCCDPRASSTFPPALQLREAYLVDRERLDQLLDSFPLEALMKKVQPKGVGLRCEIHRRNGGQVTADGWEWEDAWDRLPADMRLRVATIDVDVLEAAMHQATSTHRFCADCKHNVVTAFDIVTCKCDLGDIDNGDEFVPELFWPFAGRVGPDAGDHTGQKIILSCPLEDVEELICWHEHFDSREYTRNSQRHAATLEHGQREIRSIVGAVLLSQLRTNYHNHLAQVQGEQYLFALVLHAIRTRLEGSGRRLCPGFGRTNGIRGTTWAAGMGGGRPGCPGCGWAADPCCSMCEGTGVSLSELGFIEDDEKKVKTKSKKKRERKARAKAAKRIQDEAAEAAAGELATVGVKCNGHSANNHASGEETRRQTNRTTKANGSRQKHKNGDPSGRRTGEAIGRKAQQAIIACQRPGSSCMMSAGSLLSMLEGTNGCGGHNGPANDADGDDGIDEDLVREMERLRIQKARVDVQRSRAVLRSNLQKNFDQLLVSSTSRDSRSKA